MRGREAAEAIYYYSDHLGSSSVITDAAGNQTSHYEYTPYGSVAQTEGTDSTQYKFTGKELDNTGLYFYGARYYDPQIGRFITADTIVQAPYDPQSLNRYSYCRNNPINYVDPTGHRWGTFLRSLVGALVGGLVTGLAVVLSGGALAPLAPLMFGGISGAVSGGLSGGWQGALMGAGMGLALSGAVMLGGPLAAVGLLAGGGTYAYKQGGWSGVGDLASGVAGGVLGGIAGFSAGVGIGNTIKSGNVPNLASERGSIQVTRAKDSLSTDQKPQIKARLRTNYDVEGKAKSFDLISDESNGGKVIKVIGRQQDTAIAKDWPGHDVLDLPQGKWTPQNNNLWVEEGITNKQPFYKASPETKTNIWKTDGTKTVYGQELDQVRGAGYKDDGDYLLP